MMRQICTNGHYARSGSINSTIGIYARSMNSSSSCGGSRKILHSNKMAMVKQYYLNCCNKKNPFPKTPIISNPSIAFRSIGSSQDLQQHMIKNVHQFLGSWNCNFTEEEDETMGSRILSCSMQQTKNDNMTTSLSTIMSSITSSNHVVKKVVQKIVQHARAFWDIIMVLFRTSEISLRLSPLIILTPAAILASKCLDNNNILSKSEHNNNSYNNNNYNNYNNYNNHNTSVMSDVAWKYTLYTIQKLGPAFIKVSQWAATRRDVFPSNVCDRLSELNDAAFLHSWDHTHQVLTEALGEDYLDRLKIEKNNVIGSGSVAQVYRGIWDDDDDDSKEDGNGNNKNYTNGRNVAVKVLHPHINYYIERDLLLMKRAASIIDSLPSKTIKMLSLPRACSNFENIMHLQVDLRNESINLDRFRDNFECNTENDTMKISFPEPFLSERECLIEDYIKDSKSISAYLVDDSASGLLARRKLAGPLLRAFLKMIFVDNFVHCDLHPGNILVRKTKKIIPPSTTNWLHNFVKSDDGRDNIDGEDTYTIVFLDAGIVTSLNEDDQQNLKDLFKAVILNNGEEAGRLMVERARFERCSSQEGGIELFSKGVAEIVSEFHNRRKQGLTLGVVCIGSLLGRVLELCRVHQVEIDPAMANVVMSTLVLEGLGRTLEPNLNLFDIALPFVLGRGKV